MADDRWLPALRECYRSGLPMSKGEHAQLRAHCWLEHRRELAPEALFTPGADSILAWPGDAASSDALLEQRLAAIGPDFDAHRNLLLYQNVDFEVEAVQRWVDRLSLTYLCGLLGTIVGWQQPHGQRLSPNATNVQWQLFRTLLAALRKLTPPPPPPEDLLCDVLVFYATYELPWTPEQQARLDTAYPDPIHLHLSRSLSYRRNPRESRPMGAVRAVKELVLRDRLLAWQCGALEGRGPGLDISACYSQIRRLLAPTAVVPLPRRLAVPLAQLRAALPPTAQGRVRDARLASTGSN